jgi:tRNA A37 threonylcarbamoyladenosine synthetase subunit TsaC/SUA5/YrdC
MAQALIQLAPKAIAATSALSLQAAGPISPAVNAPPPRGQLTQARALQVVKGKSPGRGKLHSLVIDGEPTAEEVLRAVQASFRGTNMRRFFKGLVFQRQVVSVAKLSSVSPNSTT